MFPWVPYTAKSSRRAKYTSNTLQLQPLEVYTKRTFIPHTYQAETNTTFSSKWTCRNTNRRPFLTSSASITCITLDTHHKTTRLTTLHSLGPSRCFPFWQEVLACYVTNTTSEDNSGAAKCQPVLEDYYECLHHKKEVRQLAPQHSTRCSKAMRLTYKY